MAHFAEIDNDNRVLRVVVVANQDTSDDQGNEIEAIGAQYCHDLFGGRWIQTSYNASIRGKYAGEGDLYDPDEDRFIDPLIG
jgi:hypothetical protein